MKAIWKFVVPVPDLYEFVDIDMPVGARIVSAANQRERLMIYAVVTPSAVTEVRRILVALTGSPLEDHADRLPFIGTVLFDGGSFIVHLFDLGNNK